VGEGINGRIELSIWESDPLGDVDESVAFAPPCRNALEVCSAPVAVGESVRLVRVAPDSVELTWSATSNATSYTVQRSTAPSSGFGPVGTTAGTMWIDPSAGAALLFYEVESANACGQSGF